MKSRDSCEAALRLCDNGDELEVIKQNELSLNIVLEWTDILFHMQVIRGQVLIRKPGKLE
jgi:hypothetical protein